MSTIEDKTTTSGKATCGKVSKDSDLDVLHYYQVSLHCSVNVYDVLFQCHGPTADISVICHTTL